MKKETVNLFNKGLNTDLNPMTTPNDVLTDCLNGTFVTFNGDELILQNDAGNTKILVPGTESDYVQLKDGYYPIGMKEYGGILYIVSTDGENVEFGSYPSPEIYDWETGNTGGDLTITDSDLTNFYKAFVLSDKLFTAGTKIVFENYTGSPVTNLDNFSTYTLNGEVLTKIKKLYNLKLVQLLENGQIDLTESVWKKFLEAAPGGAHWINPSANFAYNCPNNFKGNLAVIIEIEELDEFNILSFDIEKVTDSYEFSVKTKASNVNSSWIVGNVFVWTKYDDGDWNNAWGSISSGDTWTSNAHTASLETQKIYYKVAPQLILLGNDGRKNYEILKYNSSEKTFTTDFPTEYQKKYIFEGVLEVDAHVINLDVSLTEDNSICETAEDDVFTGDKIYNKIPITDLNGNKVDVKNSDLPSSNILYKFYHKDVEDYNLQSDYAGHFDINNSGYPINIIVKDDVHYASFLKSKLEELQVKKDSAFCSPVTLDLRLTDFEGFTDSRIKVVQDGKIIFDEELNWYHIVDVIPGEKFYVTITGEPEQYNELRDIEGIVEPSNSIIPLKIAPIVNFKITTGIDDDQIYDYLVLNNANLGQSTAQAKISLLFYNKNIVITDSHNERLMSNPNSLTRTYTLTMIYKPPVSKGEFLNVPDKDLEKYSKYLKENNSVVLIENIQNIKSQPIQ